MSTRAHIQIAASGGDAAAQEFAKAERGAMRAADAVKFVGISARQGAAAMRQVPAQFTDIITQLQGGANPLTVLLQQGGQLKDAFGGAGNAARAMGSYVAGLVSPTALLALGAGALALGFLKGREELNELNKTLILTGNQAGITASRLGDAVGRISAGSLSRGEAASALQQVLASGAVLDPRKVEEFTRALGEIERVGGPAVKDMAKLLANLGEAPLKAANKANEAYAVLDAATVRQIARLEREGRLTEAARLAQDAFITGLATKTPQLQQNLGLIERGWMGIKSAIVSAGSALASIGRQDSAQQTLANAERAIANAERGLSRVSTGAAGRVNQERANDARAQLDTARESIRLADRAADAQRARADAAAAVGKAEDLILANLSNQQAKRREIAQAQATFGAAIKAAQGDEKEVLRLRREQARVVAEIGQKYAGPKPFVFDQNEAAKVRIFSELMRDFAGITRDATAQVEHQGKAQQKLAAAMADPAYKLFGLRKLEQIDAEFRAAAAAETEAASRLKSQKAMEDYARARDAMLGKMSAQVGQAAQAVAQLEQEEQAAKLAAEASISQAEALRRLNVQRLEAARLQAVQDGDFAQADLLDSEIALRKREAALKASSESAAAFAANYARVVQAQEQSAVRAAAQVQALQQEALAADLAATHNITLEQAMIRVNLQRLESARILALSEGNTSEADAIAREIDALGQLSDALAKKTGRAQTGQIAADLAEALVRGGTEGAARVREVLRRELVQKPFRIVIEALMRPVAQAIGDIGSSLLAQLFGSVFGGARANGGPVSPGKAYLVGERGPELLVPQSAGYVVPNGAASAAGGLTVNITNHSSAQVSAQRNGNTLEVLVQQVDDILAGRIAQGVGSVGQAMQGRFGLRPVVS